MDRAAVHRVAQSRTQLKHWRRKCRPTPVFLPEESHGQRSLAGYGPGGRKELDTTEVTEQSIVFLKAGGNISVG